MSNFQCGACGRQFRSLGGFTVHRTGAYTDQHPDYGRRCREDSELVKRGYERSAKGVWSKPMSDKARERLGIAPRA